MEIKTKTVKTYIADDGTVFDDMEKCLRHEVDCEKADEALIKGVKPFDVLFYFAHDFKDVIRLENTAKYDYLSYVQTFVDIKIKNKWIMFIKEECGSAIECVTEDAIKRLKFNRTPKEYSALVKLTKDMI